MSAFAATAAAFGCSLLAIVLLRPLCVRLGHVDLPGGPRRHRYETPLCGGLAIALSMIALGFGVVAAHQFAGFAFGLAVLLVSGVIDDRKQLGAGPRLAAQAIAVAVGMCYLGGVQVTSLGALTGHADIVLGGGSAAFTVFAAVGIINAVNMIDGMDGIAGSFALAVVAVMLILTADTSPLNTLLLCLTVGSLLGFLTFNLRTPWQPRARVFLGDAGSFILGYMLAWFAIQGSQGPEAVIDPITAVWLFGLPLVDTCYLMASRVWRGRSPLAGDRYHFHHFLQRAGLTPGRALYAWLFVAGVFMLVGVVSQIGGVSQASRFMGFILCFALYMLVMSYAWRRLKKRA